MIQQRDIIVVGLQPWDIEIGSNCKNIAIEFAKNNRVLYVNPPIDNRTYIRDKKKPGLAKRLKIIESGDNLIPVAPNIWNLYPKNRILSINWLPFTFLFRYFNRRNNIKFARDIKQAIQKLGFRDFILFNDSDMLRSYHMGELLSPSISIYYSRDNLMVHKYWYRHGHILEPELIRKSNMVLANSKHLANVARQNNPNSFDVGQGCDVSLFDPSKETEIPADLGQIQRPIIGYIGAVLSHRLDLKLLLELCTRKSEWSFVFVGKTDAEFARSPLQNLKNVHFLGFKEEKILPQYLKFFDVAFNPQYINEYTIGNYPRKVDEYLAMGKPVVATQTVTMEIFRDVVYLGETVEDYIGLIEKALKENNNKLAEQRIKFAATHTWENSVNNIYNAILRVRPDLI